jgi:hypothetical protein
MVVEQSERGVEIIAKEGADVFQPSNEKRKFSKNIAGNLEAVRIPYLPHAILFLIQQRTRIPTFKTASSGYL